MPATWAFALCTSSGEYLSDLSPGTAKKIRLERSGIKQVTFDLTHQDEAASKLLTELGNGIPQLRGYRRASTEPVTTAATLRLSLIWAPMREDGSQDISLLHPLFRDPMLRLEYRYTSDLKIPAATDTGSVAMELIDDTNADDDTGIIQGTIETAASVDQQYEHKQVAEAIRDLHQLDLGGDFEIDPLDPTANDGAIGEFNWYVKQGEDLPGVKFEYGPDTLANLSGFGRDWSLPINLVRALGQDSTYEEAEDTTSQDKYGLWMKLESATDEIDATVLQARAEEKLRPSPTRTVTLTADPALASTPKPWEDFWLGDTPRVNMRDGALDEQLAVRVNAIEIDVDDEGNETEYRIEIDQDVA